MSVYGMGSMFSGTDEQLDNFINEGLYVSVGNRIKNLSCTQF